MPFSVDRDEHSAYCGWLPVAVLVLFMALSVGCNRDGAGSWLNPKNEVSQSDATENVSSRPVSGRVVAQGILRPLGGVLSVMAPPGDRVQSVAVQEGQEVSAGDLLIELESRRARLVELDVAQTKLAEGKARLKAEKAAAEAKLQVARTRLAQAESQLLQSQNKLAIAEGEGGSLDLLRRAAELGQRKLDRLRSAANDPSTTRLVSDNKLEEESLRISETRAQFETALSDANDALTSGELSVQAAKQEIIAAERTIEAAEAGGALGALEKQIELLELSLATTRLTSPTDARILSVDAMPGQATTTMPLLHLANTSEMTCVAEVNVADLERIHAGQTVRMTSPGLSEPLTGLVKRVHQMIVAPALPNPFPMAPVDRFTAEVTIAISPESAAAAAERISLQVEVTIETEPLASSQHGAEPTVIPTGDSAAESTGS